jgi:hypothetical protein
MGSEPDPGSAGIDSSGAHWERRAEKQSSELFFAPQVRIIAPLR